MSGEMLTHALPHDAGLAVVHGKSFFEENGGCVSFSACSAVPPPSFNGKLATACLKPPPPKA
jgi:hypothetical protein